jgi:folate-dependent phosphoribosylglycinamide formyltransferase PurN
MELVGIVAEAKSTTVSSPPAPNDEDRLVIERHFAERDRVERSLLGADIGFSGPDCFDVPSGGINGTAVLEFLNVRNPDFIVVYGTGLIKAPMLKAFEGRMINIHLGLSPYYRGAGTNFWPLVKGEPECVGATIHVLVDRVDAGPVLVQVRPSASAADRAHELGTKALKKAVTVLPSILRSLSIGDIAASHQDLSQGRVCRLRDFTAQAVRTMWRNFDTGMMAEYCKDGEARRRRFPICEFVTAER